jgi:DNA-binding winged helix-turn-helix (wHTH) protein
VFIEPDPALNDLPTPRRGDEALCLMAEALKRFTGPVRLLFYLAPAPPELEPTHLLPCPARRLAEQVYVYDGTDGRHDFRLELGQPYFAPLTLASGGQGYLVLEVLQPPLSEVARNVVAVLVAQTPHYLALVAGAAVEQAEAVSPATLAFDERSQSLWLGEGWLALKPPQFAVLQALYEQGGRPCSRERLYKLAFPGELDAGVSKNRRLDQLMHRLRRKLAQAGPNPIRIETVREVGYRLSLKSPHLPKSESNFQ